MIGEYASGALADPWTQLAILANLAIVAGYLSVPATALRLIPMKPYVKWAGAAFFVTCAVTHLSMAFSMIGKHAGHHGWAPALMVINHVVQAIAVWVFILGLAEAVRTALDRRQQRPHRVFRTARTPEVSDDDNSGDADAPQRR